MAVAMILRRISRVSSISTLIPPSQGVATAPAVVATPTATALGLAAMPGLGTTRLGLGLGLGATRRVGVKEMFNRRA